jgi:hypothetical protein
LSAKFNLVCEQATTFPFAFQIKNNTTPWDITGYTVIMTIRPFVGATTTIFVGSTTNGYIVLDGINGRVSVTIPDNLTAAFVTGRYNYDLVFDSGEVTRILEGQFIVTGAVTTTV